MPSFELPIQGASIPELKEALRLFQNRCPQSNDLAQLLSGTLDLDEKGSKEGLRKVVEGVCESFTECQTVVDELLNIDEDEFPRRSYILDGSPEEGSDYETEITRRKRGKRKRGGDLLSSPPKPMKQKKLKKDTEQGVDALLPQKIPGWWPDLSIVQSKSKGSGLSTVAPPKRKQTIAEIFEADRQRRELEAQEEAERRRHEIEIQATCAQCKRFFLTNDNWKGSCVFHPGPQRRYHPAFPSWTVRWSCCGRDGKGCMEAKHIDDRIPGEVERIRAIEEAAWKASRSFVYRACEDYGKDVLVDTDAKDSACEEDDDEEPCDSDVSDFEEGGLVAEEEVPTLIKSTEVSDEAGQAPENGPPSDQDGLTSNNGNRASQNRGQTPDRELPLSKESSPVPNEWPWAQMFGPSPKRFLCHACQEEAAAKRLQCTICGDNFKALPSYDSYTAEKPICGECEWANRGRHGQWCWKCEGRFDRPMQPHWYESDCDCHEDGPCPACTRKMEEEEMEQEQDGIIECC